MSTEKKLTAVEWLLEQLEPNILWTCKAEDIAIKAKEMFKQQIVDACDYGKKYNEKIDYTSEQYYEETYKKD